MGRGPSRPLVAVTSPSPSAEAGGRAQAGPAGVTVPAAATASAAGTRAAGPGVPGHGARASGRSGPGLSGPGRSGPGLSDQGGAPPPGGCPAGRPAEPTASSAVPAAVGTATSRRRRRTSGAATDRIGAGPGRRGGRRPRSWGSSASWSPSTSSAWSWCCPLRRSPRRRSTDRPGTTCSARRCGRSWARRCCSACSGSTTGAGGCWRHPACSSRSDCWPWCWCRGSVSAPTGRPAGSAGARSASSPRSWPSSRCCCSWRTCWAAASTACTTPGSRCDPCCW